MFNSAFDMKLNSIYRPDDPKEICNALRRK